MMGDLKDVAQAGDGSKVQKDAPNNTESVEIEADQNAAGDAEDSLDEQTEALREKMAALLANPMYSLPKPVRRSVRALKNLQLQHVNLEVEFFKELHELEIKYEHKFNPLYEKRALIVSGSYKPTDEECDFQCESDRDFEISQEVPKVDGEAEDKVDANEADIKGIPDFWLTALKNAPAIADMIEDYDEPILKHLANISAETFSNPMSFTLHFHFEPNDFFTSTVLTKHYELRCTPDESDVFAFEGPEIIKCKGCSIEWKKGKNVTVKTIKKKQKHKARGAVRTVTRTVANDSFFNFFSPPSAPENSEEEEDMDEETQGVLNNDFEVGNLIKDRIIPHAVLFFTGENLVDDDFDEDDDDDEDDDEFDEDDDDDDEEEEEDENNQQCLNRKKSRGQSGNSQPQAPPECKQQ